MLYLIAENQRQKDPKRGIKIPTYRGPKIRITPDFSSETMQIRKKYTIYKVKPANLKLYIKKNYSSKLKN